MKILIAGGEGQVGREFPGCAAMPNSKFEIICAGRQQLDVSSRQSVISIIENVRPSVIVNAAAYTAVDRAEEEQQMAFSVNRDGAEILATACAQHEIPLIHISTDYVFDGKKSGDYVESDNVNPQSVYGRSKQEGEQKIQKILEQHIILRTSWVFGPFGKNFVYTMVGLAKQRKELRVVNDQFGCPTDASGIAIAILLICNKIIAGEKIDWGIYHYSGSPKTSWYEFSKKIIECVKVYTQLTVENISPIATSDYPTAAVRPQNSTLNCDKIRRQFSVSQRPWLEGLTEMMSHPHFQKYLHDL